MGNRTGEDKFCSAHHHEVARKTGHSGFDAAFAAECMMGLPSQSKHVSQVLTAAASQNLSTGARTV